MSFDFHILGAGRGGTGLLAGLIAAHPDCDVESETCSTPFLIGRHWTQAESYPEPMKRISARVHNFLEACEAESAAALKKLWGHKTTTEHIRALRLLNPDSPFSNDPAIQKLTENFDYLGYFVGETKRIPIIFIQRDGRTCIRSKMKRTNQSLDQAIANWKFSVSVLSAYQQTNAKLLAIKFEDLVTAPERLLRDICDFLGITYTAEMLAGTESDKMLLEYRRSGFDVSVVEHDNPMWTNVIQDELIAWGYAP